MGLEREVADIVDQLGSIDSDVIAEGVEHLENTAIVAQPLQWDSKEKLQIL
ncbi:hypothetical protein JL09_g4139 [Pichia kudriavzevii]|uniref:Uncharacterized protein n=1 Tax=Pichia kudriavzevii TaxID=4909 RepID=A0A099NXU2_PICKU|nr:hypothetical protein JL09_g4139 [Pichia kudriavzevii]